MKIPQTPPDFRDILSELAGDPEALTRLLENVGSVDPKGRYLHWDEMRHRTPPEGLTLNEWWLGTAFSRRATARTLPLQDTGGKNFTWSNVDLIQETVHQVDQQASGQILADEVITSLRSSDRYLVSSLVEEAITSSQLEGASTTRKVAKELLQTGRKPRDRSEQMIVNNYSAMLAAEELAQTGKDISVTDVLDLHRIVTAGTLEDPNDAGRIQTPNEERIAVRWTDDTVLHQPPGAEELPQRIEHLVDFANGGLTHGFIHPVVRAIVIHFWLAYDHPFVDGNGRTCRALFYWSMLRSRYWLTQYISISSILRKAPTKYARSYLHVETDNNDMTYFVVYQLNVIQRAIDSLQEYLARKVAETRSVESQIRSSRILNHRQIAVVGDALRDRNEQFTFQAQARRHRVTYQTARTDLLELEDLGLFEKSRIGQRFVFRPVEDLADRVRAIE